MSDYMQDKISSIYSDMITGILALEHDPEQQLDMIEFSRNRATELMMLSITGNMSLVEHDASEYLNFIEWILQLRRDLIGIGVGEVGEA